MSGWAERLLPSLDRRDRTALLACLGLVAVMVVLIALIAPHQQDDSPVPSSYGVGTHGAKAAYLLLVRSGYKVERWERPLAELDQEIDSEPRVVDVGLSKGQAGDRDAGDSNVANAPSAETPAKGTPEDAGDVRYRHTVLILAEPFLMDAEESKKAIKSFLHKGGRVIATGGAASFLLPEGEARANSAEIASTVCHARPEGFDRMAGSGEVDIASPVVWNADRPEQRVQYRCGSGAVVVTTIYGQGQIVWWASSTPLENASILRGGNLDLLLNSVDDGEGAPGGTRVIWDESLHGDIRSLSSYTSGTPVRLMWVQVGLVALLLVLSLSRRSGPLRPLIDRPRTTPVEFVESLGALYDRAGAANTAVAIAYEQFRHQLERRMGFTAAETRLPAAGLAEAIRARVNYDHSDLLADLTACESASYAELTRRRALELVRALHDHAERMGLARATKAARHLEESAST